MRLPIATPDNDNAGMQACRPHGALLSYASCGKRWTKAQERATDVALDHCRRCADGSVNAERSPC